MSDQEEQQINAPEVPTVPTAPVVPAQQEETKATPPYRPPTIEAMEEAKLKAKLPNLNRPMAVHSAFLQKRLAKGQKYFDSGDYQMAKQKPKNKTRMQALVPQPTTGEEIPTPESVPHRKISIVQSSKAFTTAS